MKLLIATLSASLTAACASAPRPLPEPPEIEPGVYLAMKGTKQQMMDISRSAGAMTFAGKYCAQKDQRPELIIGAEGDMHYLAFKCVPGEAWPRPQ